MVSLVNQPTLGGHTGSRSAPNAENQAPFPSLSLLITSRRLHRPEAPLLGQTGTHRTEANLARQRLPREGGLMSQVTLRKCPR